MVVSYAEGTTINLQDAARDLDARVAKLEEVPSDTQTEALTDRVKALEDEISLIRAALEPKS